jgi:hypothetical protein
VISGTDGIDDVSLVVTIDINNVNDNLPVIGARIVALSE